MTVYTGVTPDSRVIVDADPEVLNRAGAASVTAVPIEEYREIGHHAVQGAVENGRPVLKISDGLKRQKEIADIRRGLEDIDRESGAGRAFRKSAIDMSEMLTALKEIAAGTVSALKEANPELEIDLDAALEAVAGFDISQSVDIKKIADYENEAETLRGELRALVEEQE